MRRRLALVLVLSPVACTPASAPSPSRAAAAIVADALGDDYAALEVVADSIAAAQSPTDATPSELAQVTARNLVGRIGALHGEFDALSLAMTAAEYERGVSLWMRLAVAQAALELVAEDAARLGADPATGPAEVHDLAMRLAGTLELGRVTGRVAARTFRTSDARPR